MAHQGQTQGAAIYLAISLLLGGGAAAQAAQLVLTGVAEDTELYATLLDGSLLAEQTGETDEDAEPATPQELVAAAQADYGRLLALLYDNGYFGPTLTITLDGVDAAAIPPVRPPRRIDRAVITVNIVT